MKSIILFIILTITTSGFAQQDSTLAYPLMSLSNISYTVQAGGQPRLATSLLKEAGFGIGGGVLAASVGVGLVSVLDFRSGSMEGAINAIAIGYSFYTIGIGVGTNLARRTESYHPYMIGSVAASTIGGLVGLIAAFTSKPENPGKFITAPFYFPLVSAMIYNRLIDNEKDIESNQLSQSVSFTPYCYGNSNGCTITIAL